MNVKTKDNIQIDQTVYVSKHKLGYNDEANLREFKVTKVYLDTIEAKAVNSELVIRFDRQDLMSTCGPGLHYKAHLDKDDYLEQFKYQKEMDTLVFSMSIQLDRLSLDELKQVKQAFDVIAGNRLTQVEG